MTELVMIHKYNYRFPYALSSILCHFELSTNHIVAFNIEYEQRLINHNFLSISSYNMVIINLIFIYCPLL